MRTKIKIIKLRMSTTNSIFMNTFTETERSNHINIFNKLVKENNQIYSKDNIRYVQVEHNLYINEFGGVVFVKK